MISSHEARTLERVFYQHTRAWWHDANASTWPKDRQVEEIGIGFGMDGDSGPFREVRLIWSHVGQDPMPALRLEAFDEDFDTLFFFSDALHLIAASPPDESMQPDQVVAMLARLGVRDVTPLKGP